MVNRLLAVALLGLLAGCVSSGDSSRTVEQMSWFDHGYTIAQEVTPIQATDVHDSRDTVYTVSIWCGRSASVALVRASSVCATRSEAREFADKTWQDYRTLRKEVARHRVVPDSGHIVLGPSLR